MTKQFFIKKIMTMKKLLLLAVTLMTTYTANAQKYHNRFLELGLTQEQVDRKVDAVFDSLFFGKDRIYFEAGDSMAYVSDVKNNDVRTEGMSYGMMAAVQFDRKDMFDRLWRWCKKYMQQTDGNYKGYFRWSCKTDGTPNAQGPASDGELYYITSLLFASNRWGNNTGINYLAEAQHILSCIQPKTVTFPAFRNFPERTVTMSLIDPDTKLITFVPGMNFTDPSYHVPVFYEIWARYAQDGRAEYWRECARASREYLHKSVNPETGLTPDYNNYDGTLMHSRGIIGDAFRYDSWRVPMNMVLDYTWTGGEDGEWKNWYANTVQRFFYRQGIDSFVDQYNVDGTTPEKILDAGGYTKLRHSLGLVSTIAAASEISTQPYRLKFVERLWSSSHQPYADGYYDAYYDGFMRLFAFMHLSGRYRIIEKQQ